MRLSWPAPAVIAAAALVATAILYLPAADFPFLYDDNKQILSNENVQGWHGFARAFTVPLWSFDEWTGGGRHYRPVYAIWFTVCWLLFGDDPAGWHVLNVLLHVAVAVGVWMLGVQLGIDRCATAIAASLFAVHPINIQAAAWVAACTDTIAAIFVMASCALWVRAREEKEPTLSMAAAVACSVLAALTLERAWPCVILPPLFVWLHGREQVIRAGALFALPLAAVLLVRASVLSGYAGVSVDQPGVGASLATAPVLALRYLQNFLVPSTLSLAYPEFADGAVGVRFFVGLAALALTAGAILALSRSNGRRQFLALAAAIPFLPTLYAGLLRQSDLIQDRYLYLPLAFGSLWLADIAADAWSRGSRWRAGIMGVGIAWTLLLLYAFRPNLEIWSHELALYQRATEMAPENPAHLMNLSIALRRVDPTADPDCELLSRARSLREKGRPGTNDVIVAFNTGNCHRKHGRPLVAIEHFERSDRLSHGRFHPARRNIIATLVDMDRLADALTVAESLTRDFRDDGWSWRSMGAVLARMGRYGDAEGAFRKALELDPGDEQSKGMLREARARRAVRPITR